ncbi:hypothetical protein TNCV_209461 [Trichonephila clavipes]|uniref:Uncharacterized protein n=1 Tax=Trichonephila clavipes TaxID=2585209 RepID=A0A8X6VNJ3_TRICX|nr:hypothetical protein TNCV_209461 [Trichonephila clavipes]
MAPSSNWVMDMTAECPFNRSIQHVPMLHSDQEDHEERGSNDRAPSTCGPHSDSLNDTSRRRRSNGSTNNFQAPCRSKSKRPFRAFPLTPEHRQLRLQWCQARSIKNVTDWQNIVFSVESRFVLGTDDNRVRVWRRPVIANQGFLSVFVSFNALLLQGRLPVNFEQARSGTKPSNYDTDLSLLDAEGIDRTTESIAPSLLHHGLWGLVDCVHCSVGCRSPFTNHSPTVSMCYEPFDVRPYHRTPFATEWNVRKASSLRLNCFPGLLVLPKIENAWSMLEQRLGRDTPDPLWQYVD